MLWMEATTCDELGKTPGGSGLYVDDVPSGWMQLRHEEQRRWSLYTEEVDDQDQ